MKASRNRNVRKCSKCGKRRLMTEVLFVGWDCSDPTCTAKYRHLDVQGVHHHAMWMCAGCRQARFSFAPSTP